MKKAVLVHDGALAHVSNPAAVDSQFSINPHYVAVFDEEVVTPQTPKFTTF